MICPTCIETFQLAIDKFKPDGLIRFTHHHRTVHSFSASVKQDCYLCTLVWNTLEVVPNCWPTFKSSWDKVKQLIEPLSSERTDRQLVSTVSRRRRLRPCRDVARSEGAWLEGATTERMLRHKHTLPFANTETGHLHCPFLHGTCRR